MRIFLPVLAITLCWSTMGSCSHGRQASSTSKEARSTEGTGALQEPANGSDGGAAQDAPRAKAATQQDTGGVRKFDHSQNSPMELVQTLPDREGGFWNLLITAYGVHRDGKYWLPVGYLRYFNINPTRVETFKEEWETVDRIYVGETTGGKMPYRFESRREFREYFKVGKALDVPSFLLLERYVPLEEGVPKLVAKYAKWYPVPDREVPKERRWYTLDGRLPVLNGLRASKVEITFGLDSTLKIIHDRGTKVPVSPHDSETYGPEGTPMWTATDPPDGRALWCLQVFWRIEPPPDGRERSLEGAYWAVRFDNGATVYQTAYSRGPRGFGPGGASFSWDRADGLDTPDVRIMNFYADYRMEPVELSYYDGETEFKARIVRKSDSRKDLRPMEWTYDGLVYKDH